MYTFCETNRSNFTVPASKILRRAFFAIRYFIGDFYKPDYFCALLESPKRNVYRPDIIVPSIYFRKSNPSRQDDGNSNKFKFSVGIFDLYIESSKLLCLKIMIDFFSEPYLRELVRSSYFRYYLKLFLSVVIVGVFLTIGASTI